MKARRLILLCVVLASVPAAAQGPTNSAEPKKYVLEGTVVNANGEPVKKALVEIITENQQQGANYSAVTDQDGHYRLEAMQSGRYTVFAERTGLIQVDKKSHRTRGTVLSLEPGQEVTDLLIRMLPAAVITGRVVDEDGDPILRVDITVSRKTYTAGHQNWETISSEGTNDLGQYRISGLLPGRYFVSAYPPPSFQSVAGTPKKKTNPSNTQPETAYVTTYYPGTIDRNQAAPVEVHPGDELPVNFSLVPSRTFTIRGSVANVPAGAQAIVMLQSREANITTHGTEVRKDGSFEIPEVSPGTYSVNAVFEVAEVTHTAHRQIDVTDADIDGLRLSPISNGNARGIIRVEDGRAIELTSLTVVFANEGEDFRLHYGDHDVYDVFGHVQKDGSFELKDIPPGTYRVQLLRRSHDCFLRSVSVDGRTVPDSRLIVSGSHPVLDLVVSTAVGKVDGAVMNDKNEPVPNAIVVAVPEPKYRKASDHYQHVTADQRGHFSLQGLIPDTYTVFAWEDLDGEPYYDPDFLKAHETDGQNLRIEEGGHSTITLRAVNSDQPSP